MQQSQIICHQLRPTPMKNFKPWKASMTNGRTLKQTFMDLGSKAQTHLQQRDSISQPTKKIKSILLPQLAKKDLIFQFCAYSKSQMMKNLPCRSNFNFQIQRTQVQKVSGQTTIVTPFQKSVKQACSSSSLKTNLQKHIPWESISSAATA